MQLGIAHLITCLEFRYPAPPNKFILGKGEIKRLVTAVSRHVEEGTLFKGTRRDKKWLTFVLFGEMGSSWLQHAPVKGTSSWDITIVTLLAVMMMSALDCRWTDIGRSQRAKAYEYMRFEHITLKLEGDREARFDNVVAIVTIAYGKGNK